MNYPKAHTNQYIKGDKTKTQQYTLPNKGAIESKQHQAQTLLSTDKSPRWSRHRAQARRRAIKEESKTVACQPGLG